MPARVRRFTPSMSIAPAGAFMASLISPSVIVSQRQMTRAYAGFSAMRASCFSGGSSRNTTGALRLGFQPDFSAGFPIVFITISSTYSAMAGDEASPGDSMPMRLMNLSLSFAGVMMKSSSTWCARMPAKDVIMSRVETCGTDFWAVAKIWRRAPTRTDMSSTSSTLTEEGPTRMLW